MKITDLIVEKRTDKGKNHARRLRCAGKIPAIIYGKGSQPISLAILYKDLQEVFHGKESTNMLLNIKFADGDTGGDQELISIPKAMQIDPLSGKVIHLDLLKIHLDQELHTQVPIHLEGTPAGVRMGGVLEHLLREIEIVSLPMDIPEYFAIDISQLEIGDSLHVRDLQKGEKMKILTDPSRTVTLVAAPTIEKEPEKTEEEVAAEAEAEKTEETKEEGAEGAEKSDPAGRSK